MAVATCICAATPPPRFSLLIKNNCPLKRDVDVWNGQVSLDEDETEQNGVCGLLGPETEKKLET